MRGREALAVVAALSERAVAAPDSEAALEALVDAIRESIPLDQVHVTEVSQDAALGRSRVRRFGPTESAEEYVQVFDHRPSGAGRVVETGQPLHLPDARDAEGIRRDYVARFAAGSLLFLPVKWSGEVRFVLVLVRQQVLPYEPDEITLAEALANAAAAGLAVQELRAGQAAQPNRDAALARAARALTESLDLETVLETLAREADLAVGGDLAGVYLGDAIRGGVATAGHNTPPDWEGYVMKPGEGVAGQVLATGRSAITNAYQSEVQIPESPGLRKLLTAVSVPVRWGGELRGALSVGFARMRRITREDLRTLEAIADLAGVACRNAEDFQRLESGTRIDALTGLLDHNALLAILREEIARARREQTGVACIVLDLDDFESIVERAGHLHGDDVLVRVAGVLKRSLRPFDAVARFGADEFAMVLPRCSESHAHDTAAAMQAAVARQVQVPAGCQRLTCSIGIARWDEPLEAGELLDLALAAVRDAKRAGKARIAP